MFYKFVRLILIPIVYILFLPRTIGKSNIQETGSVIIYSNHTSLLDPIILACVLPRQINFMAKEELFQNRFLASFFKNLGAFPVKRSTADISAVKNALRVLRQDDVFGIFPEGTRNNSGDIKDFARGIASIAHRSKATTIPIAIKGGYRLFKPIKVVIGKPVDFGNYILEKSNSDILDKMSDKMVKDLLELV